MKRGLLLVLGLFLLGPVRPLLAQETMDNENMRFVNVLRQRGDHDLARAFLEKMRKTASPALAVELQLEISKTRLAEAAVESDSNKKQVMLNEARQEFDQFLTNNPKHPRARETRLEIAQVAVQQGKILLSKALSAEGGDVRRAEGARARAVLEEAGKRLKVVAKEMQLATDGLPEPKTNQEKAERQKLDEDRQAAELAVALNLFDQAMTYPRDDRSDAMMKTRGDKFLAAYKELTKIAAGSPDSPYVWQAMAWVGRCIHENGDPNEARRKYTVIILTKSNPAAAEAQRLARYFRLLAIEESDNVKDKAAEIEDGCTRWLKDYPRSSQTPEAYGIRYLLAQVHLGRAAGYKASQKALKDAELARARTLLREIEQTENEYSDRARAKKLAVMKEQGSFDKKIEQLTTFEDCFVRAQFEMAQIAEDMKNAKTPEESDKVRVKRIDHVTTALERGLGMPEAKGKRSPEIGKARAILAFFYLNTKHYRNAIRYGETLARDEPGASQAANAASYALQAYSQWVADHEVMLEKSTGDLKDDDGRKVEPAQFAEEIKARRARMMELARYMEKMWPRENAADLARHQLGILLIREKADGEDRVKNLHEAIRSLGAVTPAYPLHANAVLLLAYRSMKAEEEHLPVPQEPGKPPLTWRQRALAALEGLPEPVGGDPTANKAYVEAKAALGGECYKDKKFDQMEQLATGLLPRLAGLKFSDVAREDSDLHEQFQKQLSLIRLYGLYGKAEAAFAANDHVKVSAILDPLVDEVKANPNHTLKTNLPLGQGLMSMALRTYIQTGKLDRARIGIAALQQMSGDEDNGASTVLRQLLALINKQVGELRQKGDMMKLKQAVDGFTALLDDIAKSGKPTPQFILNLAQCYSSMDLHARAIDLILTKFPKPKAEDAEGQNVYKGSQLVLAREYRLNKEIAKAKPILEEIMGTKDKPQWGARNKDALKEWIAYLLEEEKYAEAYRKASALVNQLKDKVEDNTDKGYYLEFYSQMVLAMYQFGQHSKDSVKKDKYTADAAQLIVRLEKRFMGFGNEATAKRLGELLQKEPALKAAYDKIKAEKAAGN